MKHTTIRLEAAPSSANTFGSVSADDSRDLSMDGDRRERRHRDDNRRSRRKGDKIRAERREKNVKKMLTPAVKVLLFGVLLSVLDVLYIMKRLDESSEIAMPNNFYLAQPPSGGLDFKTGSKQSENKSINSALLAGREPIIKLIQDAGISFDPVEDADLIKELPKWSDVVEMYGPEPVIYGINEGNCERFQAQTDKGDHFIGTAGTFNTGTNLMSELLIANCILPDRMKKHGARGIRWQVPWGKHNPVGDAEYRNSHKSKKDVLVDANEIMPMVTIRDPLIWLKSMCRHKYTAVWEGFKNKNHCPNFLVNNLKMNVKYGGVGGFVHTYKSVLHLWNDFYQDYKNVDIPFLLVRFEDLVFRPKETITKVCECGGGMMFTKNKFKYIVNSAKKGDAAHGNMKDRTGFVDALVKYGKIEKRYKDFDSIEDLKYVRDNIDGSIMEMMKYSSINPSWNTDKAKTI